MAEWCFANLLWRIRCHFFTYDFRGIQEGEYGAEEYFKHFLIKNPRGKIIQEEVQILGTDGYLHSGMYDFEVGPGDDRKVVEARFSFVWKKDDQGEWKIVHHHSSARPKG